MTIPSHVMLGTKCTCSPTLILTCKVESLQL
jgi:hypothetical protein